MTTARKLKACPVAPVRCAIYTRKSTEEGLDQEFSSLDAQREAAEAYILSQAHAGWTCLPEHYDDGGFSGRNLDRPALQRLLAAVQAGQVDCVLTHRVDRLSRSLLDFARLMETFEQHQVTFVSVTQHFHSGTSMGRLILHVLLSFAQFERELIAERTRDKVAAARRKGKWTGGLPCLGYDVDAQSRKLVVNAEEAERVRAIFALYLEHRGLLEVVAELGRRGWLTKQCRTRQGTVRGGRPFTKGSLYALLTNFTYLGQVRYQGETYPGEQPAVVDRATWEQVQAVLAEHGRAGAVAVRSRSGALLQGLLRCRACGAAMTPAHVRRRGNRRYRYYTCTAAQQHGWPSCPSKALPAGPIERYVLEQLARHAATTGRAATPETGPVGLADWQRLAPAEQARCLRALVERVDYDGRDHQVAITLRRSGPPTRTGAQTPVSTEGRS
jgi:site-specific DNA recombinase